MTLQYPDRGIRSLSSTMLHASMNCRSSSDTARFVLTHSVVCNRIFQSGRLKKHLPVGLVTYVQRRHLSVLLPDVSVWSTKALPSLAPQGRVVDEPFLAQQLLKT
jgi:hypothetical protein